MLYIEILSLKEIVKEFYLMLAFILMAQILKLICRVSSVSHLKIIRFI